MASAITWSVGTLTNGIPRAREIPLSVENPILKDVKEPGPRVATKRFKSLKEILDSLKIDFISERSSSECYPSFFIMRTSSLSSFKRAMCNIAVDVSTASTFIVLFL